MAENTMQHGKLGTDRCPRIIDQFVQFDCQHVSNIVTPYDVEIPAFLYWETSCEILQKPETKTKKGHRTRTGRRVARFARVEEGIHRKSSGRRSVSIKGRRNLHEIKEAPYSYSLPKRPKLRRLLENQNDRGSLQKANW